MNQWELNLVGFNPSIAVNQFAEHLFFLEKKRCAITQSAFCCLATVFKQPTEDVRLQVAGVGYWNLVLISL